VSTSFVDKLIPYTYVDKLGNFFNDKDGKIKTEARYMDTN